MSGSDAPEPGPQHTDGGIESHVFDLLQRVDGGATPEDALAQICQAVPELRDALQRRLASLRRMGMLGVQVPPEIPERLGDFRLLRRLGGGGMGVVYLAEQEGIGRTVALKVIHPAQMHFEGARARFQREVETIANLQHPAIVPVHAVGETDGVPWFTMERVAGCTIHELLLEVHGLPAAGLSGADMAAAIARRTPEAEAPATPAYVFSGTWEEAALLLVQQVADALHHAHRRGVLHRDVKPSNVMVTLDGRALLLDFGLASAADDARPGSSLTRTGSPLGSLPYMSPEQARGESTRLDARTDIYSLGATLYELLALRPAFGDGSAPSTLAAIQSGQRATPRECNPAVSWEAETVCLTAMEPAASRRYASAADLHRDLGNVLEHRPIEARRAGRLLSLRRWAQRRPAAATGVVLGSLLLVGGPSLYAWQQHAANLLVTQEQVLTEQQRLRAEASLHLALKAVDTMLTRVSDQALRDVPQMEGVRRDLADQAVEFYRVFIEQQGQDPDLLVQIAAALQLVGEIHHDLGDYEQAKAVHSESVEVMEGLLLSHPELPDPPRLLALGLRKQGLQLIQQGAVDEGLALTRRAIEIGEALLLRDDASSEDLAQLGISVGNYGGTVYTVNLDAGLSAMRRAVEIYGELAQADPADDRPLRMQVMFLANLGALLGMKGDKLGAFPVYEQTITSLEGLLQLDPGEPELRHQLGTALMNYGTDLGSTEEQAAQAHLLRAVEVFEQLVADFPYTTKHAQRLGQCIVNRGVRYQSAGQLQLAEEAFRRGEQLQEQLVQKMQNALTARFDLALTRTNLAGVLVELDALDEAEQTARGAIEMCTSIVTDVPEHSPALDLRGTALRNLGEMHAKRGHLDEAIATLELCLESVSAACAINPDDFEPASHLRGNSAYLARLHLQRSDHGAAQACSEFVVSSQPDVAMAWFRAAASVAACVPVSLVDPALAPEARVAAAETYEQRAFAMLRRAAELGAQLQPDLGDAEEWAPVRALDGFADFVSGLTPPVGAP